MKKPMMRNKHPLRNNLLGMSTKRLLDLKFDPIVENVKLARKYEEELVYHEMLRKGQILDHEGKPKRYSSMAHTAVMQAYQKCINDLMRYGYARVPETIVTEEYDDDGPKIPTLNVTLNIKK